MSVLQPIQWFYREFGIASIHETGRNAYLIILARSLRMLAYGGNSLILAIFFSALGYSDHRIGVFMTLTLLGDVFLGTLLTLIADRVGRRKVLMGGSMLMIMSGTVFATLENFWILLLAAISGVLSVTGGDYGPFRSIEESILSQLTTPSTRSDVLAWYVTTSTLASSIGSELSGRILHWLENRDGWTSIDAYHALFWMVTAMGFLNVSIVLLLTNACELQNSDATYARLPQEDGNAEAESHIEVSDTPAKPPQNRGQKAVFWLTSRLSQISAPTRSVMYKLWFLLAVDAIADGMVPPALTNYYMDIKFHPLKSTLGDINAVSDFLSGIGAAFAAPLARKIGLVNTMVFTHVPSSASVLFFPFPPAFWMTAGLLFVRKGLNNMDQAPRSAFIASVVKPEERTAVMGITSMLRTLAATTGPTFTGFLASSKQFWIAFVVAGACRLLYDFGLYAMFVNAELHQHEGTSGNQGNGREARGRDEEMELQSLTSSDGSDKDPAEESENSNEVAKGGLQLPASDGIRSRSPHR